MKINTDHTFKPGEIGKVCTFKNTYVDAAGTIPAKVGDTVARIDWDDGEPLLMQWHPDNQPILCEDGKHGRFLGFRGAKEEERPTCTHCGSDDLIYREQYANGAEHECRQCGQVFMVESRDVEGSVI